MGKLYWFSVDAIMVHLIQITILFCISVFLGARERKVISQVIAVNILTGMAWGILAAIIFVIGLIKV